MYTVGITGASGAIYAQRLLVELARRGLPVNVLVTRAGREVLRHELGWELPEAPDAVTGFLVEALAAELTGSDGNRPVEAAVRYWRLDDWNAPVASGSARTGAVVVVPCSMGTLGRIAHGISGNLLERAADVALKERRPLVVVPREAPLSVIHLENMLTLARAGATILPAMPAFYAKPRSLSDVVDFVTGRILDQLGLAHDLFEPWAKGGDQG